MHFSMCAHIIQTEYYDTQSWLHSCILYAPSAVLSLMTVLKKKMFVPGLTISFTPRLMYRSLSLTVYVWFVNDNRSGEKQREKVEHFVVVRKKCLEFEDIRPSNAHGLHGPYQHNPQGLHWAPLYSNILYTLKQYTHTHTEKTPNRWQQVCIILLLHHISQRHYVPTCVWELHTSSM